jgi:hypothetical protein
MELYIFLIEGKFGIGICFHYNLDSFVQAHTMISPYVVTAAECEACTNALAFALSTRFERDISQKWLSTVYECFA